MRRNPRGGRGGQNWQTQRQNPPRASGGPMMNNFGLQDIDKELELLKRKREIIEQQQKILSNEFRRNDYQEPQYSQNSRYDDYAQAYDNVRSYEPPSRKRPIAVWENDIPAKRFSGPTRTRARPVQRSGPTNRGGYQAPQPRAPFRPPPGPIRAKPQLKKDFPPRAARYTAATINKLNTYPVADRKKLVNAAVDLTSEGSGPSDSNNRLRPDHEPSKQVTGRLELALGMIIKNIRANADHEALKSQAVVRHIKKTVRDRIREVMMDRVVGSGESVKARYREIYPEQSDFEVVSNAIDAIGGEVTLIKIDDPEEYFKKNMHKIMQLKLQSLLHKLEETYRAEYGKPKTTAPSDKAAEKQPTDTSETKTDEKSEINKDETEKNKNEAEKNKDEVEKNNDETETNKDEPETNKDEPEKKKDETEKNKDETEKNKDEPEKNKDETEKNNTLDEKITSSEKYRNLERYMSNKMVHMIKKFVPYIMKIMDIDTKYCKLKNTITSGTVKMLMQKEDQTTSGIDSPDVSMRSLNAAYNATSRTPKTPYKPLPYFVKLMGKPSLPKRHHMQKFFEEFQPKSIKKHRSVHNLLFVGFHEKESFDKLLAADGTVIGKHTLSIRVSERSTQEAKKEIDSSTTSEVIGAELDEQITDLLTSIRKAEEDDACENGTPGEAEVTKAGNTDVIDVDTNNTDVMDVDANNADVIDVDANNADGGNADAADPKNADDIGDLNAPTGDLPGEENEDLLLEGNGNGDLLQEGNGDISEGKKDVDSSITEEAEAVDQVPALNSNAKPSGGQATPATRARSSARLSATPSKIQTRRASKLAQND